jgi:hypothetical protein
MKVVKMTAILVLSLSLAGSVYARSAGDVPRLTVLQCLKISPNISTGHSADLNSKIKVAISQKENQLRGLSYNAVIPWVPKKRDAVHRFFIEKLDFKNPLPLPAFDKTQKLGKTVMRLKDIRFSQVNCRNMSQDKKYTVVGNAQAIKEGKLDISMLPTIKVWRDTEGRVWTLDHRRLAAMRLSGVIDNVEVDFVSEHVVKAQGFKFGTHNDGKSIFVHLDNPETKEKLAIVLIND